MPRPAYFRFQFGPLYRPSGLPCLARETEEGRRRRQQQQQQQQVNPSSAHKAANATASTADLDNATTQQLAPAAAPRADHAVTAGGEKGTETLGGDNSSPDDIHGTDTVPGNTHGSGEGQVTRKGPQDQWQGPPQSENDRKDGKASGPQEEGKEQPEEAFPTWNGGECRDGLYAWNQSIREARGGGAEGHNGSNSSENSAVVGT